MADSADNEGEGVISEKQEGGSGSLQSPLATLVDCLTVHLWVLLLVLLGSFFSVPTALRQQNGFHNITREGRWGHLHSTCHRRVCRERVAAARTEVLFNNEFCREWLSCTGAAPKYLAPVMWEPTLCPEAANSSSHPHSTIPSPGQGSAASTCFPSSCCLSSRPGLRELQRPAPRP